MLDNRKVRRRQSVLAGRASPLSPLLHQMEPFNLPTLEVMLWIWCLSNYWFLLQNENTTKSHMKYVTHVIFLISVILFALFLRKLNSRVVTFAPHVEEFPKSPSLIMVVIITFTHLIKNHPVKQNNHKDITKILINKIIILFNIFVTWNNAHA